jgi:Ca2+-binding EF-hand superfamily protein
MATETALWRRGAALALALGLAACSSVSSRHGRLPDGLDRAELSGGMSADPAALFLGGLDTNLDGVVTTAEVAGAMNRLWTSADTNGDGKLSIIELLDWRTHWFGTSDGWPGRFFFDSDGDGSISRDEFETGIRKIFDAYDRNHDGKLERTELVSRAGDMRRRRGEGGGFKASPRIGGEGPPGDGDGD